MGSHDYALVVGFSDYDPSHYGLDSLAGPANDVAAIRDWLEDRDGGNLPSANIVSFPVHSRLDASQYAVDDALLSVIEKAKTSSGTSARRFYFFFCGHGQTDSAGFREDNALCLPSWTKVKRHRALSSMEYAEYMRTRTDFQETWMFLDCCRTKAVKAAGFRPTLDSPALTNKTSNSFIAFATSAMSEAFEDTGAANPQGHFTKVLIQGLKGAAMNPQGLVTVESLKTYMNGELPSISRQKPRYLNDFTLPESQVVIVDLPTGAPQGTVNITLSAGITRPVHVQDTDFNPVRQIDAGQVPSQHRLQLPLGLYSLVSSDRPPTIANIRVSYDGETIDVTL